MSIRMLLAYGMALLCIIHLTCTPIYTAHTDSWLEQLPWFGYTIINAVIVMCAVNPMFKEIMLDLDIEVSYFSSIWKISLIAYQATILPFIAGSIYLNYFPTVVNFLFVCLMWSVCNGARYFFARCRLKSLNYSPITIRAYTWKFFNLFVLTGICCGYTFIVCPFFMYLFASAETSAIQSALGIGFGIMNFCLKTLIMALDSSPNHLFGLCWVFWLEFMSETFVALLFPDVKNIVVYFLMLFFEMGFNLGHAIFLWNKKNLGNILRFVFLGMCQCCKRKRRERHPGVRVLHGAARKYAPTLEENKNLEPEPESRNADVNSPSLNTKNDPPPDTELPAHERSADDNIHRLRLGVQSLTAFMNRHKERLTEDEQKNILISVFLASSAEIGSSVLYMVWGSLLRFGPNANFFHFISLDQDSFDQSFIFALGTMAGGILLMVMFVIVFKRKWNQSMLYEGIKWSSDNWYMIGRIMALGMVTVDILLIDHWHVYQTFNKI
eukprot:828784_1